MPRLLLNPGGVSIFTPLEGKIVETHSSTCSHCQRLTEFPAKKAMMDHVDICRGCMKLICLSCVGQPCRPWEQECERLEQAARLRENIHIQGWRCY